MRISSPCGKSLILTRELEYTLLSLLVSKLKLFCDALIWIQPIQLSPSSMLYTSSLMK
nr:MAG TPA: hypothetical protein [Caudoviricetes sp.]